MAQFRCVRSIPNPEIFISPLRIKEAVFSSKIEGTQTSFAEVLKFEAGELPLEDNQQARDDYTEVNNYRKALVFAEKSLEEKPFHLNLLLKIHEILLDSVRGRDKARGKFRTDQNWIGPEGCPIEEALYVPPRPMDLPGHLGAWERYYHLEDKDPLVQLAVVHAQFEIIHPFLDGNGRLGRILIPLFLYEKELLSRPVFYLSVYLEAHREEYTQRLRELGTEGAWDRWIFFFLTAIQTQADKNRQIARDILALYEKQKRLVVDKTRSANAISVLDYIFQHPIFLQSWLSRDHRVVPTAATAGNIVKQFIELGILKVSRPGTGRRSTIMYAPELFHICEPDIRRALSN